jgi:hypothetical protein
MDPSRDPNDTARAVGSLSLSGAMLPSVPHLYPAQMATASYPGPGIPSTYHIQSHQALYYPLNWPAGNAGGPSEPQPLMGSGSSPPTSDEGELRVDREHGSSGIGYSASAQKTLFIAGFPPDVKEREIFNLLRFQPGFLDCSLTPSANGKQVRQ